MAIIGSLASCTQSNNPKTIAPDGNEESETIGTLCFNRYSGLKNQDTAFVKLVIDGDSVSGHFSNIPYEKDSRVGTIAGVKSGNLIKGIWSYQQEGMSDSIAFEFKLQDSILLQKETTYDLNTGREILLDTSGFTVEFVRVDCQTVN